MPNAVLRAQAVEDLHRFSGQAGDALPAARRHLRMAIRLRGSVPDHLHALSLGWWLGLQPWAGLSRPMRVSRPMWASHKVGQAVPKTLVQRRAPAPGTNLHHLGALEEAVGVEAQHAALLPAQHLARALRIAGCGARPSKDGARSGRGGSRSLAGQPRLTRPTSSRWAARSAPRCRCTVLSRSNCVTRGSRPRPAALPSMPCGSTSASPSICRPPHRPSTGRPAAGCWITASSPCARSRPGRRWCALEPGRMISRQRRPGLAGGGPRQAHMRHVAQRLELVEVGQARIGHHGDGRPSRPWRGRRTRHLPRAGRGPTMGRWPPWARRERLQLLGARAQQAGVARNLLSTKPRGSARSGPASS